MNLLDILLIIIPIVGFILGYKDGFVRKIIGLAGIIIGIYLGVFFAGRLGRMIESSFEIEYYLASIIAGVAIFLVIVLIFSIIKRLVHPFDKVNNFINQTAGGVLGAIQILFFTSAVLYLLNIFSVPKKNIKESSFLYGPVYSLIPSTIDFVGSYTPYANERKASKIIKSSK